MRWGDVEVGDIVKGRGRPVEVERIDSTGDGQIYLIVRMGGRRMRFGPADPKRMIPYGVFVAFRGEPHYSICSECGDVWPCTHMNAVRGAERILAVEASLCEHCRRPVTSGQMKYTVATG